MTQAKTLTVQILDKDYCIACPADERANLENEITRADARLNNPGFTGKAPAALVETEQQKLLTNKTMLAALDKRIAELKTGA